MDFWHSLAGMEEIRLTCADLQRILGILNQKGIALFDLVFEDELTCVFSISRADFKKIREICLSYEVQIEPKRNQGIYWAIKQFLCRPVLVTGFLLFLFLTCFLPSRVLFVRVEGNKSVPDKQILEASEACGIRFGASRQAVRSEKVKNALIGALPQLQWAGVNTRGCVAVISVRERTMQSETSKQRTVSSIVSATDGYILSATATRGTLLVAPGQSVTAGQTLISGYTDLELFTQATAAEGEIYAQTQRVLETVTPASWYIRQPAEGKMKKISLLIGKKRINLWKDSGISGTTCGRMYEECYVTLPGNFVLPLAVCIETLKPYIRELESPDEYPDMDAMDTYAVSYLRQQMIAGQIVLSETRTSAENGIFAMQKLCICQEMIGRPRQEQIGAIHE